jgi:hypothetical protein
MAKQVEEHPTAAGAVHGAEGFSAPGYSVTGTDQGGHDAAPFVSQVPGTPVSFPSFHGRPVSWVAVSLIMAAFLIGGLALVFSVWWLFWASVGLGAVGGLLALGTGIFDDWY